MTIRRRTLIEPRDITGIEYECGHCSSRYTVPIDRFDRRVEYCPNCHERWLSEVAGVSAASSEQAIAQFVSSLKEIQTRRLGVVVRLEIAESEEKAVG